ncbi:AMP-binding protein [Nocardia sp. NPDC127579]|uniref:AMP-binding protein n=1 Tax=Nocardia sp. NPDC127579 TaxID=3345402 RepID=UPI0036286941
MMTWIARAAEGTADAHDRPAIIALDCLHTYGLLAEAVELFAEELRAAGVGVGDRVAVYIHFGYEALLAVLAVNYLGAVVIPLDIREPTADTERALRSAGARRVLGHSADDHIVEEIAGPGDRAARSVAGDYTLIELSDAGPRSEQPAGFVFCAPGGAACRVVETTVLADSGAALAGQWGLDTGDTVAPGPELGVFEAFAAATATLLAGATLCLDGQWSSASVLVRADRTANEPPPDRLGAARFGRWAADAAGSADGEVRQLRFPARTQGLADSGRIRRCG